MRRMLYDWAVPLSIALLCLLLQALGLDLLLRYEHPLIVEGQFWRVFTGHFVHLGWAHLGLNVLGLGIVWLLLESRRQAGQFLLYLAASSLMVGLALWFFSPQVGWYVGLSGALHGLLVLALVEQWRYQPLVTGWVSVLVLMKLVYEHNAGPLPGSQDSAGGPVLVISHVYGVCSGFLLLLLEKLIALLRGRSPRND